MNPESPLYSYKSLKDAIPYLILKFPSILTNRAHVLNAFFCMEGIGFRWHKGDLVDWGGKNYEERSSPYLLDAEEIVLKRASRYKGDYSEEMEREDRIEIQSRNLKMEEIVRRVDYYKNICEIDFVDLPAPIGDIEDPKNWGRLAIPDNASLEWSKAAYEMTIIMSKLPKNSKDREGRIKNSQARKIASLAKKKLESKFESLFD